MTCEFCGGETHPKSVRKSHWFRQQLYLIENVTAEVCQECGERYFHAKVLDEIDTLLTSDYPIKERLQVDVVRLEDAALA